MIRLLKQIKLMEDCILIHSTVTNTTNDDIDRNLQYLYRKLGDTIKRKYNRIFQEDM